MAVVGVGLVAGEDLVEGVGLVEREEGLEVVGLAEEEDLPEVGLVTSAGTRRNSVRMDLASEEEEEDMEENQEEALEVAGMEVVVDLGQILGVGVRGSVVVSGMVARKTWVPRKLSRSQYLRPWLGP